MIQLAPSMLRKVLKPARYTGGEWNQVVKDLQACEISFALAFPDVYEVGMSHLGLKILYHVLNSRGDTCAERVYAPWPDMEEELRRRKLPLFTLETRRPLAAFDLVGFTLQYELSYSNILNMLDLGGISVYAQERNIDQPFVVGGGPCAFNPEPLASFFDLFVLGEAEEAINELVDCFAAWKKGGKRGGRDGFLRDAAGISGVYVPKFYLPRYDSKGNLIETTPAAPGIPETVNRRVVADLEAAPFPVRPVVPYVDAVHDRIMLEVFRGCTRGCRFCQAGILYRPVRERRMETIVKLAEETLANTGYDEISLVSLSTADYSCLEKLIRELTDRFARRGVSVSLPSLRVDSFSIMLANEVQKVRKSSLTFAPEAGTQRLRDVINKGVSEQDIEEAVTAAFRSGWSQIKLYFMLGLPTETDEDVRGIAELSHRIMKRYKEVTGSGAGQLTVSVSSFVPKPHTAFQWVAQASIEELRGKQALLKELLPQRRFTLRWHDAQASFLEAVFARGDRRLEKALYNAWQRGARFDGWSEHFRFELWEEAFQSAAVDPNMYATRERSVNEALPWDHLNSGVDKHFLVKEYERALNGEHTADCRRGQCTDCGVCSSFGVGPVNWG